MPFLGDVVVTPCGDDGKRWRLVEPFQYEGKYETFDIPKDFETDFASVPRVFVWLLPRYGRWTQAAILHDYLWSRARRGEWPSKADADGIFNRALRELEVPFLRRWLMWTAVRWAAGPSTWFTKGPVPFMKMIAMSIPAAVFLAIPTATVVVALLVGGIAEWITYVPLKLLHRNKAKEVVPPDPGDFLLS